MSYKWLKLSLSSTVAPFESISNVFYHFPVFSLPTKTECWELDDVFLLVSKVFKENELNCLWKAEMDSVLDQLIVRRVPSLQSLHAEIKQEQDISDIVGNQQSENYVREPDIFDLELPPKEVATSEKRTPKVRRKPDFIYVPLIVYLFFYLFAY